MSEAVFSISADITPHVDEQELERQALLLSNKINGVLAKKINKVDVAPTSGGLKPFEQEVSRVLNPFNKLTNAIGLSMPKAVSTAVRAGKGAFLKFSDTINLTRRDMVGFNGSILDAVRDTGRFKGAINDIKAATSGISELPRGIQQVAAQARSGTSILDRAALAGNRFAQFLQPLEANGATANKELSELVQTLRVTAGAMMSATRAMGGADDGMDLIDDKTRDLVENYRKKVNPALTEFNELVGIKLKKAMVRGGTNRDFVNSMIELKKVAKNGQSSLEQFAGPLGFISTMFDKTGRAARKLAKIELLNVNRLIHDAGGGDTLSRWNKMTLAMDTFKRTAVTVGQTIQTVSRGFLKLTGLEAPVGRLVARFDTFASGVVDSIPPLSQFGTQALASIRSVGNSLASSLLGRFPQFSNEALTATERMNKFVAGASNFDIAVGRFPRYLDAAAKSFDGFLVRATSKIATMGSGIANSMPGKLFSSATASVRSLGNSISSKLLGRLPQFSNEALSATERMNKFVAGASNLDIAFDRIQKSTNTAAKSFGTFVGKAFGKKKIEAPAVDVPEVPRDISKAVDLEEIKVKAPGVDLEEIKTPMEKLCAELHACFRSLNSEMEAASKKAGAVASAASKIVVPKWSGTPTAPAGLPVDPAAKKTLPPDTKLPPMAGLKLPPILAVLKLDAASKWGDAVVPSIPEPKIPPVLAVLKLSTASKWSDTKLPPLPPAAPVAEQKLSPMLTGPKLPPLLTGPLLPDAVKKGADVTAGIALGMQNGKAALAQSSAAIKNTVVSSIQEQFQMHSASKAMEPHGRNIVGGLVKGIKGALGLVPKALDGLLGMVGSVAAQAAQFAKSVAMVGGAALAGLGGVALKTGADFNILKQVINSTLPVLVGSKEASAALLVEINALNSRSPYARSAFLELTRVLAGFGVEAKRITPLIDAIQQTVAATGGSEADLLELGQGFARIQSQGKVSADVLQSFSSRGVDATAILAKGFGKTTGEMRDMISNGLIPADKAIDTLTKGLKEKFDGATEAVAKNFPGALQRVKARLRDIGGTLMTAFITPEGGGALVDFLNNMADALSHVNGLLKGEKFQSFMKKVGDALIEVSKQVKWFITALTQVKFDSFINGLGPVLPLLAAFMAFLPGMMGFIPVIGPMIAGLGGPFAAMAAGIGVVLAQSGKFGETMASMKESAGKVAAFFKDNFAGVFVFVGIALSQFNKVSGAISGGLGAAAAGGGKMAGVFGRLGKVFTMVLSKFPLLTKAATVLSGPIGIVVSVILSMILTSKKFRDALMKLWEAVKPVAMMIGGVLALAMKILDGVMKALEPLFVLIINYITAWFNALKPLVEWVNKFIAAIVESGVIEDIWATVAKAIEWVIEKIQMFIDWYNKIPFLPNVNIELVVDPQTAAADKAIKDHLKHLEELRKASKKSAEAITDNYKKASKEVEKAQARMSSAKDAIIQGVQQIDSKLNAIFSAGKAVKDAIAATAAARLKEADAIKDSAQTQKDYARALADSISPLDELNRALRDHTRLKNSIRDLDQDLVKLAENDIKLREDRAKLVIKDATDDRAALVRSEQRAQISLNRAKQAELDLLNELNGANKISINLAGLSLDQIRAKLAAVRLSSNKERKQTAQEIADSKTSARLDVLDAEQAMKDATAAKGEFELDLTEKIKENTEKIKDIDEQLRENDERRAELQDDRLDKLLDEIESNKGLVRLREGESTQAAIIKDFQEKIKADAEKQKEAHDGIKLAMDAERLTGLELKLQSAILRGDAEAIATAQQAIWKEKQFGLTFDGPTLSAIQTQKTQVGELLKEYQKITAEVQKTLRIQEGALSLESTGSALRQFESLQHSIDNANALGDDIRLFRLVPAQEKARNDLLNSLRTSLLAGAAEQKDKGQEHWFPTAAQVEAIIREVADFKGSIRDAIRIALNNRRLSMPGFAAAHGYAPGDLVHRGMNDGVGLMRWAEFGKEAILPLTRKFDMARVVQNPNVLPAILNALPRWRMPESTNLSDSSVSDLSTMIRSGGSGGGPANSDVYQKKSQREFASTIGDAVYTAVKTAIEESDGLGADVDINVMPSTSNEKLIAREVRRQVDKALGKKW